MSRPTSSCSRSTLSMVAGHCPRQNGAACSRSEWTCVCQSMIMAHSDLHRVGAQLVFIDVRAPARACGDNELAILDDRRMSQQLRFPRHLVDIVFGDAQIGDDGGK